MQYITQSQATDTFLHCHPTYFCSSTTFSSSHSGVTSLMIQVLLKHQKQCYIAKGNLLNHAILVLPTL